jgi:hypothetical protein
MSRLLHSRTVASRKKSRPPFLMVSPPESFRTTIKKRKFIPKMTIYRNYQRDISSYSIIDWHPFDIAGDSVWHGFGLSFFSDAYICLATPSVRLAPHD